MNTIEVNINDSVDLWHLKLFEEGKSHDFNLAENNIDNIIWFVSNYTQYLVRSGNSEVVPVYGKCVHSLKTLLYQLNLSLPVGYKMKSSYHALYDLLLIFETEPAKRIIIWNDASHLFMKNKSVFEKIFELMVVSAYCNRKGISTIKENVLRYQVDQRNIFIFSGSNYQDIEYLLNKEYYIPSIDSQNEVVQKLDFNRIYIL